MSYSAPEEQEYDFSEELPPRREVNPLKPFVIALVVLLIAALAVGIFLFVRLQDSEASRTQLETDLNAAQAELFNIQAELAAATPTPIPTPTPTPTPEPTPEITPEPTPVVTPEPTPSPLLKDQVTAEQLGVIYRPDDQYFFETVKAGQVSAAYMLAVHVGPGIAYTENMVLMRDDCVELLALYNGWYLLRTNGGQYGWAASELVNVITATPAPTNLPEQILTSGLETAGPSGIDPNKVATASSPDLG